MICAPGIGCVLSSSCSKRSAGGQLEHPSEVKSSTRTGAGELDDVSVTRAITHVITKLRTKGRIFVFCIDALNSGGEAYYLIRLLRDEKVTGVNLSAVQLVLYNRVASYARTLGS